MVPANPGVVHHLKGETMYRFVQFLIIAMGLSLLLSFNLQAEPVNDIKPDEKCRVCGMFVAKYLPWVAQIHYSADDIAMFDGVKDMMAFYFEPKSFGAKNEKQTGTIYVKDYYTQKWLDGTTAVYVVGSDIMGPMGHEFIPFDSTSAAENFMKDHKGKKLYTFHEITLEQVTRLRSGMKMMGKKMDKNNSTHDHSD
ncbi:MAG: copper chaperone NosL [Desulforhopalus sp.]|jgi:copper chaperone NosL